MKLERSVLEILLQIVPLYHSAVNNIQEPVSELSVYINGKAR